MERAPEQPKCLACGGVLAPTLRVSGSLRCHDCRDVNAPLRAEYVEPQAAPQATAPLRRAA
jgi:hypothetical protein